MGQGGCLARSSEGETWTTGTVHASVNLLKAAGAVLEPLLKLWPRGKIPCPKKIEVVRLS